MSVSSLSVDSKVFVMLDSTPRTKKPTDEESDKIDSKFNSTWLTLEELSNRVLQGETWCPGIFNGHRCGENFIQAQLIAMDMENGIGPEEAMRICNTYGIPPCWGYYSFSHTSDAPRYRLIWRLDHVLGDKNSYEIASNALYNLFKGTADPACVPACWRFYGTCNGQFHYEPNNVVSLQAIVDAYCVEEQYRDKTNASKRIKRFASKVGLEVTKSGVVNLDSIALAGPFTTEELINRLPFKSLSAVMIPPINDMSGDPAASRPPASDTNSGEPVYIYMSSSSISKTTDAMGPTTVPGDFIQTPEDTISNNRQSGHSNYDKRLGPARRKLLENVNFDYISQHCQLYNELMAGKPLRHNETFGLMTSLLRCKGGETKIKKGIEARAESKQDPRYQFKWNTQIKRCKDYNYLPQHCNGFCPYCKECTHLDTPLDQLPIQRGAWRKVESSQHPVPLAEAEAQCPEIIKKMISSGDGGIYIGRFSTSLGKTSSVIGMKGFILSAPTHNLAKQMMSDAHSIGNDPIYIPELPYVDSDFRAKIDECYRIGDTKSAYFGESDHLFRSYLTGRFSFNLTDLSERKRRWTW